MALKYTAASARISSSILRLYVQTTVERSGGVGWKLEGFDLYLSGVRA